MDALRGELDNVHLHDFDTKQEDYFMILMSAYGTNEKVFENNSRQLVDIG